jgi:DNA-binding ferritin-like protein
MSDYNGYELFEDVEDQDLRAHNRAACLFNMFHDVAEKGLAKGKNAIGLMQYMALVPEAERKPVVDKLTQMVAALNKLEEGDTNDS